MMYVNHEKACNPVKAARTPRTRRFYTMHVHSNHPDLLSASLRNVSPELNHGPNNGVEFEVLTDQGVSSGEAPNSVVIVTGPPN